MAACLAGGALRASAQEAAEPIVLDYVASSGCPDRAAFEAVDATRVYVPSGTSLVAVPIDGGSAKTLATGMHPIGVAVDASYVYWTDPVANAVMKMLK
jgi:hypothetical protein